MKMKKEDNLRDLESCCFYLKYQKRDKYKLLGLLSLFSLSFLILSSFTSAPINFEKLVKPVKQTQKRNLIMMISDGFGPASETFTRNFLTEVHNLPFQSKLPLDNLLVGQSRTRSSSSLVTDSAAGATAFACSLKTYNGAIGVEPVARKPCGTVLEAAYRDGYKTGLVVTSRITHATPASFAAHVVDRDMENLIAEHLIGNYSLGVSVDLLMGGGSCHFKPKSAVGSCRKDERDLFAEAGDDGWDIGVVIKDFEDLNAENYKFPLMRLLTPDHMSYEIDRNPALEPSLLQMVNKTLQILTKATENSEKGFFLMIEGSRIDMAAHSNDAAGHLHEIMMYQQTIEHVKSYIDSRDDSIMISVADHETGGLVLAKQPTAAYPEYKWNPKALQPVTSSSFKLALEISFHPVQKLHHYIKNHLTENLGFEPTSENINVIYEHASDPAFNDKYIAELVNAKAEISWGTHGHSAVDVNLYAHGLEMEKLRGNKENIEIGMFIQEFLGVDLKGVTEFLQDGRTSTERKKVKNTKGGFKQVHIHHAEGDQEF